MSNTITHLHNLQLRGALESKAAQSLVVQMTCPSAPAGVGLGQAVLSEASRDTLYQWTTAHFYFSGMYFSPHGEHIDREMEMKAQLWSHSTFTCSFCGLVFPEQLVLGSCPSSHKDTALAGQRWRLGRGPEQGHFSAAVQAAVHTCAESVFSSHKLFQIYSVKR